MCVLQNVKEIKTGHWSYTLSIFFVKSESTYKWEDKLIENNNESKIYS